MWKNNEMLELEEAFNNWDAKMGCGLGPKKGNLLRRWAGVSRPALITTRAREISDCVVGLDMITGHLANRIIDILN